MKKLLLFLLNFSVTIYVYASPDGKTDPIKHYEEAFSLIQKMLEGDLQPSFRDAVFLTENAYTGGQLNYANYMLEIASIMQDVQAIRSNLQFDYTYFDKRDVYTNGAIFRYFTDTITYQDSSNSVVYTEYPYQYNFDDPLGEKDWSNMFVTSLMKGQKGNCHSLPYLYKIIANEFKVNAHLVLAPNHIYITHLCHDPAITWYNSELTSGTHPIDSWIMISTYMSMDAVRNGIYGLPLEDKQSIALTLVDLANGYIRKFPNGNKDLPINCLNVALKHFPECINAMLLKLKLLGEAYTNNPTREQKIIIDQLARKIHELGYDEMPRQMYEDWLGGRREYDPNYKPFKEFNDKKSKEYNELTDKPLLTASNGRYLEYHWTDSLELIGNILYDTKRKEVAQILTIDTTDIVSRIPRDVASRWLSPDPLMDKYPANSPYMFVANSPIIYIDPDGRDYEIYIDHDNKTIIVKATFRSTENNQEVIKMVQHAVKELDAHGQGFKYAVGKGKNLQIYNFKLDVAFVDTEFAENGSFNSPNSDRNPVSFNNAQSLPRKHFERLEKGLGKDLGVEGLSHRNRVYVLDEYNGTERGDHIMEHEMGHSLGIIHSDDGIMNTTGSGHGLTTENIESILGRAGFGRSKNLKDDKEYERLGKAIVIDVKGTNENFNKGRAVTTDQANKLQERAKKLKEKSANGKG